MAAEERVEVLQGENCRVGNLCFWLPFSYGVIYNMETPQYINDQKQ